MCAAGEWVRVKSRSGHESVALVVSVEKGRAWVFRYRRKPERLMSQYVRSDWILGAATECEDLEAAREILELDSLRERRLRLGVLQQDFAELVGVSQAAVRDAEHGRRTTQKRIRHWILLGLRKLEAEAA